MPPRQTVEIACDESGFVGGSLFDGVRVFAHASLRMGGDEAAELVAEVRRRTSVVGAEVKASHLNRPWGRDAAAWLCAPDGPLAGRATVHVSDTRLFGLARLAQLTSLDATPQGWWSADRDPDAWQLALRLDRLVADLGPDRRQRFLAAARDLLWVRRRSRQRATPSWWRDAVADLPGGLAAPDAVRRIDAYLAEPPVSPLTEPLLPALGWAVEHWSTIGDPDVVHDEQSLLTDVRVREIDHALRAAHPDRRLAGFVMVDSRRDARVQLADLVAGVGRRVLEDRFQGRIDTGVPVDHLVTGDSLLAPAAAC